MNDQTTVSLNDEENVKSKKKEKKDFDNKPTPVFIGASWTALLIGMVSYCIGLWNANYDAQRERLRLYRLAIWIILCNLCAKGS
jgi:uncharacterized membrane protein YiaA